MQLFDLASGQTDVDPQWPFAFGIGVWRNPSEGVRIPEVRQLDLTEIVGDGIPGNYVVAGRRVEGIQALIVLGQKADQL